MAPSAHIAFIFPSGSELFVLLVVGIVLFGRRLPQVGKTVARTIVQLRQGLHKLQAEMELDEEMRDVKDTFRETRHELTEATHLPRGLSEPGRMLEDLTDATLSSVVPDDVLEDVPDDLFSTDGEGVSKPEPASTNGTDT